MNTINIILLFFIVMFAPLPSESTRGRWFGLPSKCLPFKNRSLVERLIDSLKPASIVEIGRLLIDPESYQLSRVKEFLLEKKWPPEMVENIAGKYNVNTWPSGLKGHVQSFPNGNEDSRKLLGSYNCRYIPVNLEDSCQAVIVFGSENITMPDDMNADEGLLMFFNEGGIIIK